MLEVAQAAYPQATPSFMPWHPPHQRTPEELSKYPGAHPNKPGGRGGGGTGPIPDDIRQHFHLGPLPPGSLPSDGGGSSAVFDEQGLPVEPDADMR
jgi:hypothetical protein